MPRFSIIMVHYQGVIPHRELIRFSNSLFAQSYSDYEILAYHDGPLLDTSVVMPFPIKCLDRRYGDWGHTQRDLGIREAKGDYIVHMNSDNVMYPNALEEISQAIDRPPRMYNTQTGKPFDTNDIIVYSIWAHGIQRAGDTLIRLPKNPECKLLLSGNPPRHCFIDVMQFVMRRELWLAEGGWYDKSNSGDGLMYEKFAKKYGYRSIETILGEHF